MSFSEGIGWVRCLLSINNSYELSDLKIHKNLNLRKVADESLWIQNPKNGVKRHLKISYKSKKDARNHDESMIADGPISTESGIFGISKGKLYVQPVMKTSRSCWRSCRVLFQKVPQMKANTIRLYLYSIRDFSNFSRSLNPEFLKEYLVMKCNKLTKQCGNVENAIKQIKRI